LPAQFTDAFGVQNDSLSLNFTVPADDDLGAMTVQVKGWSDGRTGLLEVMNRDGAVLRTALIQRDSSIRFEALQPGPVRLRLIADQDGNGRWSPGKFMRGLDPEQVWFHPVTVLVRARWDVEAVFSINSIAR
jgi:hypothetical protein